MPKSFHCGSVWERRQERCPLSFGKMKSGIALIQRPLILVSKNTPDRKAQTIRVLPASLQKINLEDHYSFHCDRIAFTPIWMCFHPLKLHISHALSTDIYCYVWTKTGDQSHLFSYSANSTRIIDIFTCIMHFSWYRKRFPVYWVGWWCRFDLEENPNKRLCNYIIKPTCDVCF